MAEAVELADGLPLGEDFRLGYAAELERAGQSHAAESQLQELLRREPDYPPALVALATLLADHGRAAEARALAAKALDGNLSSGEQKAFRSLLQRLQ
jgi:predicted Zn-dependent protease